MTDRRDPPAGLPAGRPVGRRVVLGVAGLGALAVLAGDRLSELEQRVLAVVGPRDPTGLTQLVPAGAGFRFYSVTGSVPRRDPAAARVAVGGLVRRPATLSMADLARLPQTRLVRDFQCVTGWRVPEVPWTGVALPDLLDAVGIRPGAAAVRFTSYDGAYTESLTLEQARRRTCWSPPGCGRADQPRARRPGPAGRAAHVRLQVAEVAGPDRGHRRGAARLLGAARLRRGRLRRPVQRAHR